MIVTQQFQSSQSSSLDYNDYNGYDKYSDYKNVLKPINDITNTSPIIYKNPIVSRPTKRITRLTIEPKFDNSLKPTIVQNISRFDIGNDTVTYTWFINNVDNRRIILFVYDTRNYGSQQKHLIDNWNTSKMKIPTNDIKDDNKYYIIIKKFEDIFNGEMLGYYDVTDYTN